MAEEIDTDDVGITANVKLSGMQKRESMKFLSLIIQCEEKKQT